MIYTVSANSIIDSKDLKNYNAVIINWTGGALGNFVYRNLINFISDFPIIEDNLKFSEFGSSHNIYNKQYASDLLVLSKNVIILRDIEFNNLLLKFHAPLHMKSTIFNNVKLNIKIYFKNKESFIWAVIQNILKINKPEKFFSQPMIEQDWINNQEISKDNILLFENIVKKTNKFWFHPSENCYNILFEDIFFADKFEKHLSNIADILNSEFTKEKYYVFHQNFLNSQFLLPNLFRSMNNNYNLDYNIDKLLLKFSS